MRALARSPPPLPASLSQDAAWLQQVRTYLLRKAPAGAPRAALERLFEPAAGTALLLNERVLNLPAELVPGVQESLHADLAWARANALDGKQRAAFAAIQRVLVVAPCFGCFAPRATAGAAAAAGRASAAAAKPAAKPAVAKPADAATLGYYHFEEEVLAAGAELAFAFPVALPSDMRPAVEAPAAAPQRRGGAVAAASAAGGGGGDDDNDDDEDDEDDDDVEDEGDAAVTPRAGGPLRPPQFRQVLAFSVEHLAAGFGFAAGEGQGAAWAASCGGGQREIHAARRQPGGHLGFGERAKAYALAARAHRLQQGCRPGGHQQKLSARRRFFERFE